MNYTIPPPRSPSPANSSTSGYSSPSVGLQVTVDNNVAFSRVDISEQGEFSTLEQDSLPWSESGPGVGGEEEGEEREGGGEGWEEGEGGGGEVLRHLDHATADGLHQIPASPCCLSAGKKEQPTADK